MDEGLLWNLLKFLLVFTPLGLLPLLVLLERRGAAAIQDRPGPNRAAIPLPGGLRLRAFGMIYNVTDGLKSFLKESFTPPFAYKPFYIAAPMIPVLTAVLTPALIPWFAPVTYAAAGRAVTVSTPFIDANGGLLVLFALGSLSVYGVVLGSWASNSKFALLGGMRASAMMISYEVSMGLSVLGLFLLVGSFSLNDAVAWQSAHTWGVFVQPIGFLLFLVAMFAETNRNPFDVAEGESEIVAGFHTEYAGVKFALFMMGEYAHIAVASALIATLYFGGYDLLPLGFLGDLEWTRKVTEIGAGGVATEGIQLAQKASFNGFGADFIRHHLGGTLAVMLAGASFVFLLFALIIGRHRSRYAALAASDKPERLREYGFFRAVFWLICLGSAALAVICLIGEFPGQGTRLPGADGRVVEVWPSWVELLRVLVQIGVLLVKTLFFCWLFVWVRWTLPRFRYDQIMNLGWKVLLNVALLNLIVTAIVAKLVGGGQ